MWVSKSFPLPPKPEISRLRPASITPTSATPYSLTTNPLCSFGTPSFAPTVCDVLGEPQACAYRRGWLERLAPLLATLYTQHGRIPTHRPTLDLILLVTIRPGPSISISYPSDTTG
ncbi:hypothetical protein VDGE_30107 [Verticillium dahliae]|uniref:Uncharacterized protein n=1 Tax=Verticillium dahliae TaxID=27337 RepID=A0A444S4S0_VERDA|nr:hypothetical protein VDGE_30107 [Verticillium dahliae]